MTIYRLSINNFIEKLTNTLYFYRW